MESQSATRTPDFVDRCKKIGLVGASVSLLAIVGGMLSGEGTLSKYLGLICMNSGVLLFILRPRDDSWWKARMAVVFSLQFLGLWLEFFARS